MSRNLQEWLRYQERLHPQEIDLGLDRVLKVYRRLSITTPNVTISVAGTNGKGSCIAYLESVLRALGRPVAAYTSPHLRRYNERLRINGKELGDDSWCQAFESVEAIRGDISLTYFEFGTLAALWLIARHGVEYQLLEVGLGGRLDAVNIVDADVSVVTSIGTDHADWLGEGRESIAREKAGIFRRGKPAVCGDPDPPASLVAESESLSVPLYCIGRDFDLRYSDSGNWTWRGPPEIERENERENESRKKQGIEYAGLPALAAPSEVQYQNAATALMVLQLAGAALQPDIDTVGGALTDTVIPARCEIRPGKVTYIFDVAHNLEACQALAQELGQWRQQQPGSVRVHAVFSALADKPIGEMCKALAQDINAWYVGGLSRVARGMGVAELVDQLSFLSNLQGFNTVLEAWQAARAQAKNGDAILVFGSFHILSEVLEESHE